MPLLVFIFRFLDDLRYLWCESWFILAQGAHDFLILELDLQHFLEDSLAPLELLVLLFSLVLKLFIVKISTFDLSLKLLGIIVRFI